MGLSSKKVSSDGLDWSEGLLQQAHTLNQLPKPCIGRRQLLQNQHQTEPLKCPRCDSTNTKFCYYNNYNKSQPRHFCKSCRRHWTKGGTLRNVPVGGGRKNKRLRTSKISPKTATTTTATNITPSNIINRIQQNHLALGDHQKSALNSQHTAVLQHDSISNGVFMGSTSLSHPQAQELSFPYSNSSSFDSISTPFQSSNVYNYSSGETIEDINSIIMPTTSTHHQLWQLPNACHGMDYLNCDDIDNFVSSSELNVPWDDFELKP